MRYVERLKNPIMKLYVLELIEKDDREKIKELQKCLVDMGRDLEIDGIFGPITTAAVKSVNNRRLAQMILDYRRVDTSKSRKVLVEDEERDFIDIHRDILYPSWIKYAMKELGVKERRGKRASNPRVEQYHDAVGLPWAKDDVPWCGAFVGFCMLKAGYKIPKDAARALSWRRWGKSAGKPVFGAIAVKKRKGGGHVTFVVGQKGDILYCLGGNQHDEVCVSRYKKSVFIDFRIPKDYLPQIALTKWRGISSIGRKEI